jgi:hypothetical protein
MRLRCKFAVYADNERGRYPIWESLDHDGFFPGSGVIFVTVTVAIAPTNPSRTPLTGIAGRLREAYRCDDRRRGTG